MGTFSGWVTCSGFLQGSLGKWLTGPGSSGIPLPIPGPAIAGSFLSGHSRGSSTAAVCLGIGSLAWVLKRKSEGSLPFDPGPCRVCRCYGSSVFFIASGMITDGLPASQPQTPCPFGLRHKTASLVVGVDGLVVDTTGSEGPDPKNLGFLPCLWLCVRLPI